MLSRTNAIREKSQAAWQHFLLKLRYQEADIISFESGHSLRLAGAQVWIVASGTVQVYVARLQNDTEVGPRLPLFDANENQILFGDRGRRQGFAFFANGTPQTQLFRVSISQIQEFLYSIEYRPLIEKSLESWISGLSSGIAKEPSENNGVWLEAEKSIILKPGQGIARAQELLWMRHLEGSSRFVGRHDIKPITGFTLVPICRTTWLEPISELQIQAFDTSTVLHIDPAWSALNNFHDLILDIATIELSRSHNVTTQTSIDHVAAELQPVDSTIVHGRGTLLEACRLVLDELGVTLKLPAGIRYQSLHSDPVAEVARDSRVRVRRVELDSHWWRENRGPMLAYRGKDRHPVALLHHGRYIMHDSLLSEIRPVNDDLAAQIEKSAYLFYRPLPDTRITASSLMLFILRDARQDLLLFVGMGLMVGVLSALVPLITQTIFDTAIPSGDHVQLILLGVLLILSAVAATLFNIISGIATLRLEGRADSNGQAAVWDRLLRLPMSFFRRYTIGDLTGRAMGITQIRALLSDVGTLSLLSSIFSIVNLLLLFYYDAVLALIATGLLIIFIMITAYLGRQRLHYQREVISLEGQNNGLVLQLIAGISKLRVASAEQRGFSQWAEGFVQQYKIVYRARMTQNTLAVVLAVYPIVAMIVLFVAVLNRATLTIGQFLAFNTAFAQVLYGGLQLGRAFVNVQSIAPIYDRLRPIIETLPENNVDKVAPGTLSGSIEIQNVSFRYRNDGPLVLDTVSLNIKKGEFVAFVSASGGGKTTLMRLLLGLETPENGNIYYDGQALSTLDVEAVRRQIGVVLQSGQLTAGDIFSNIVGATNLTIEDAWQVARLVGIEADIKQMPMGMHTYLNEGSSGLSGGQIQRLLIARALAKRPKIIFFDEATSSIDNYAQDTVMATLTRLNVTRVVIAHRLSTIVNADRIFVLKKGQIVECGTYEQLVEARGYFFELSQQQTES